MKLLDLFCGAGGAAMGYHRAGFDEIVGVDIVKQKRYPFHFMQADALDFCASFGAGFDVIHASPPCQMYSSLNNLGKQSHRVRVDIIPFVRDTLRRTQKPYVIENVPNSPLSLAAVRVCGQALGLQVRRHRLFESSNLLIGTPCANHTKSPIAVYGDHPVCNMSEYWRHRINRARSIEHAREAMGINWMDWREITQAIPPAYTEFIGRQLLDHLTPKTGQIHT